MDSPIRIVTLRKPVGEASAINLPSRNKAKKRKQSVLDGDGGDKEETD